ncbi:MAG: L,D-transpeptidase, partial [Mesorhizobium sp.]
ITPEDAAGPYVASIPEDYSQKAQLDRMGYTSVPEALAERFHMDEAYLKSLNPEANFNRPGTIIKVANFGRLVATPVARIIADKANKQVRAYDAAGKLVAAYPATIGSSDTPSPSGTHTVSRVALDPNYTYNPNINFKQGE